MERAETVFVGLIPELEGIQEGDVLVVNKYPATHRYSKAQRALNGVRFPANAALINHYIKSSGNGKIAEFRAYGIKGREAEKIIVANGYDGDIEEFSANVYMDMVSPENPREVAKPEEAKNNYSMRIKDHDESIIKEMIGKVDLDRMEKLCKISMRNSKLFNREGMNKALEAWAHAKYEFYLAFGRNLSIHKDVQFKIDPMEIAEPVFDLYKKYPKYAATIDLVTKYGDMDAYINNSMPDVHFFAEHVSFFTKGMKVSGFFNKLFEDEKFNIDFSKVLQDRNVNGKVVVSIDPYDYLTAAINMHGWSTCHKLFDAPQKSWTFMTDDATIVAFRENGKIYTYDKIRYNEDGGNRATSTYEFKKNSFSGNSKSWRQFIFVDKDTCAIQTGREFPKHKDVEEVPATARGLVESAIASFVGFNDEWDNYGDLKDIYAKEYWGHTLYHDVKRYHYSDIANWGALSGTYKLKKALVTPANIDMTKVNFNVGGDVYCLSCGKKLNGEDGMCCCG